MPDQETDDESRKALANLQKQIGSGPFEVSSIEATPNSHAAPQRVTLLNRGTIITATRGKPLWVSGYYLSALPNS